MEDTTVKCAPAQTCAPNLRQTTLFKKLFEIHNDLYAFAHGEFFHTNEFLGSITDVRLRTKHNVRFSYAVVVFTPSKNRFGM